MLSEPVLVVPRRHHYAPQSHIWHASTTYGAILSWFGSLENRRTQSIPYQYYTSAPMRSRSAGFVILSPEPTVTMNHSAEHQSLFPDSIYLSKLPQFDNMSHFRTVISCRSTCYRLHGVAEMIHGDRYNYSRGSAVNSVSRVINKRKYE